MQVFFKLGSTEIFGTHPLAVSSDTIQHQFLQKDLLITRQNSYLPRSKPWLQSGPAPESTHKMFFPPHHKRRGWVKIHIRSCPCGSWSLRQSPHFVSRVGWPWVQLYTFSLGSKSRWTQAEETFANLQKALLDREAPCLFYYPHHFQPSLSSKRVSGVGVKGIPALSNGTSSWGL